MRLLINPRLMRADIRACLAACACLAIAAAIGGLAGLKGFLIALALVPFIAAVWAFGIFMDLCAALWRVWRYFPRQAVLLPRLGGGPGSAPVPRISELPGPPRSGT